MSKVFAPVPTIVFTIAMVMASLVSSCDKLGGKGTQNKTPPPDLSLLPEGDDSPRTPEAQEFNTPWGVQKIECEDRWQETSLEGQACSLLFSASKSQQLLLSGRILTADAIYENGEVLIDSSGLIACVGCNCDRKDAPVLSCPSQIISPGLINAHDHLGWTNEDPAQWGDTRYNHRHNWRMGTKTLPKISSAKKNPGRTEWGELRQLMSGTTSIAGSSGAPGFVRNIDSMDEFINGKDSELNLYPSLINETFPLGDSSGHFQSETCEFQFRFEDEAFKRNDSLALLHVSEGIDKFARNEFLCLSGARADGTNIIGEKTLLVHAIALNASDGKRVQESKASVVWSPRSNISLYGQTAPVNMLKNQGVRMAIGTDWMPSGSTTLNREMVCAHEYSQTYLQGAFSPRDIWMMATGDAAMALGKAATLGHLKKGAIADVLIVASSSGDQDPYLQLIQASAKDSLAVFKGGRFMFGAEYLAKAMSENQLSYGPCYRLPQEVCGQAKSLCGEMETKQPLADFFSEHENSHPLFTCDSVPKDEPSCVPQRPDEYTGTPTDDDLDGDGILTEADNCPAHFNPLRPVDGMVQLDSDGDGLGDECDPCPLDKDQACSKIQLGDLDQDSIPDSVDNCPLRYNQEQRDQDGDGLGDVCDACLEEANPDGVCSATIAQIKNKRFPRGTKVRLQATVAGIEAMASAKSTARSLYLANIDGNLETIPFGGIFVYRAKGDVSLGSQIQIAGVVDTFYGQWQLKPLKLTTLSGGQTTEPLAMVEAIPLSPLDLPSKEALTPEQRHLWEGRLVRMENLTLSKKMILDPATAESLEEILLDEQLLLDPLFGQIKTQDLYAGDAFHATGFLAFKGERWALIPRDAQDLEVSKALPAQLQRFSTEEVVMEDKTAFAMAPLSGPLFLELNKPATQIGKVQLRIEPAGIIDVIPQLELVEGVKSLPILLQGLGNIDQLSAGETLTLIATLDGVELRTTIKVQSCSAKASVNAAALATARLGKFEAMEFRVETDLTAPRCELDQTQNYELLDAENKVIQSGVLTLTPGKMRHALSLPNPGNGSYQLVFVDSALEHAFTIYPLELRLTEIYYDHPGDDKGQEWIEIENTSGEDLDLSRFVLALARNKNYRDFVLPLRGTLPAGACYVVGQPDFVDFQANFGGEGITNGGKIADGVAIFAFAAGAATLVEPDMLPHDSVLYGLENRLELRNPDGTTDIHFAKDGTPGRSLSFSKSGWQMAKPSPGQCSQAVRDDEENGSEDSSSPQAPSAGASDDF